MTTSVFRAMAKLEGSMLGYPQSRVVVVPHPLGGLDADAVRAKADGAVDAVLAAMRATA
jgi:hypothetical protein